MPEPSPKKEGSPAGQQPSSEANDPATEGENHSIADDGGSEIDPYLQAAIDLRESGQLSSIRLSTAAKALHALDVKVNVLRGPEHAGRLAHRHEVHMVKKEFAQALYEYLKTRSPESAARLKALRKRGKEQGMFVLEEGENVMSARLEANDPLSSGNTYIITEAWGRHPDPLGQHPRSSNSSPAADCHIHVPGLGGEAAFTIQTPREGDEIIDQDFVDNLEERKHRIACIEDSTSDPDMMGLALAANALDRAIVELVDEVNPKREGDHIEFLTAELVCLKGIRLTDGTLVPLSEVELAPMFNDRAAERLKVFRTPNCTEFETVFILRDREVPVTGVDGVAAIIVDWHTKAARVRSRSAPAF